MHVPFSHGGSFLIFLRHRLSRHTNDLNMGDKIKLSCWVQSDEFDKDALLQVHMSSADTISMLKQAIMPLLSEHISMMHMKLWKVGELYWFGAKA